MCRLCRFRLGDDRGLLALQGILAIFNVHLLRPLAGVRPAGRALLGDSVRAAAALDSGAASAPPAAASRASVDALFKCG